MSQSYQTQASDDGGKRQEPTIVIGIDFGTTDKEKVPSAIYYDNKGEVFWGYSIPEKISSPKIEWFKLCLLEERDIPKNIRNAAQIQAAQKSLKESNRRVVDVISDYLRELWKHSIVNIRRAIGGQLVDISRFKVIVTLPAIWPAYAQLRMLEAIEKAGILETRAAGDTILEFLSEPEAAALATIKDMCTYSMVNMEVGDHFVVCDAGGGTVDVITYTVIKADPIRVKESVKGDDAEQWVKQKRTHDQFRFTDIKISAKDAQNIFKPTVGEIETLVIDQAKTVKRKYKKEPKFLVLVGGFGRQPFLYTRLQDQLNRKKSQEEKTELLQGSGAEPWTAVCRGAVIRGLELSEDTTESTGTTIPVGESVEKGFHWDLVIPATTIETTFIYSTENTPSNRCDETVKKLCDVRWSSVPDFDSLPTWINPIGDVIRRIDYDVKMTSNGVTLDFEIIYNNQVMASKKIGIDYGRCGSTVNQALGASDSDEGSGED
ncbi:hypothetical protein TrVFT333_005146 [Trichoderma virens FT-333]|nr:hypothetical protein TrVFT333_005146 [Trichoderma virens FT-333]